MKKLLTVIFLGLLVLPITTSAEQNSTDLANAEMLRLGERMYREGILPSGEPMKALVSGDVPVEGTYFTCVSCHLRSGLGSLEGDVSTPPTNGRILYESREPYTKGKEFVPSFHNYSVDFPARPAYTDESLAALITSGVDPLGRSVLKVMPQYDIEDNDMTILIAYLKTLSDKPSPGVTEDAIMFATVVVEGTDKKKIDSMLAPLAFGISRKNSLSNAVAANDRIARMGYNMLGPDLMKKKFALKVWTLKGPSSTWRTQLDEYYQENPVFALLSGLSESEWQPVHRFCEDNNIPNILPIVDYPVISNDDWYTLYFSRGVRQEGEAAARYLNSMADLFAGKKVVQVFREKSKKGQALSQGFRDSWSGSNNNPLIDIVIKGDAPISNKRLVQINSKHEPAALIIWDDFSSIPAITNLAKQVKKPGMVISSGTLFGEDIWTVPEELRDYVYFTYPYRLPSEDARYDSTARRVLRGKSLATFDANIVRQAYITNEILGKVLMKMRDEYYRDFFLDVIGMMEDAYYPLYERLTFGPGQRYSSKGCFLVQVSKGEKHLLERRSDWIIQ